jgi:hypothetical protein
VQELTPEALRGLLLKRHDDEDPSSLYRAGGRGLPRYLDMVKELCAELTSRSTCIVSTDHLVGRIQDCLREVQPEAFLPREQPCAQPVVEIVGPCLRNVSLSFLQEVIQVVLHGSRATICRGNCIAAEMSLLVSAQIHHYICSSSDSMHMTRSCHGVPVIVLPT